MTAVTFDSVSDLVAKPHVTSVGQLHGEISVIVTPLLGEFKVPSLGPPAQGPRLFAEHFQPICSQLHSLGEQQRETFTLCNNRFTALFRTGIPRTQKLRSSLLRTQR